MHQFPWSAAIFTVFLILSLPMVATGAVQTAARGSAKPDEETTGTLTGFPANSPNELLRFLEANAERMKPAAVDKTLWQLFEMQNNRLKSYESQLFSDAANPVINRPMGSCCLPPKAWCTRRLITPGFRPATVPMPPRRSPDTCGLWPGKTRNTLRRMGR